MDSNQLKELEQSVIGRIATGPDLSKDITFQEAKDIMCAIINSKISDIRSAVILIALRMKRETMEENKGILSAVMQESIIQNANVTELINLGEPYSGYNRSVPISSFLPPLLAELGLPTIIHGLNSVSPKYGLTHRHINQALGLNANISPTHAKKNIENKNIAWTYLDQEKYCNGLHKLVPLRNEIIKRSVLNTIETLVRAIYAKKNYSIIGFVHKPYPPIYADLANFVGFDSTLLIRGIEGGVVPSLRQIGLMISYHGNVEKSQVEIDPKQLGIKQDVRAISLPNYEIKDLAKYTVELGIEAINGKNGIFYDGLLYASSLILWHLNKVNSLPEAAEIVRATLDSGKILNRITGAKK